MDRKRLFTIVLCVLTYSLSFSQTTFEENSQAKLMQSFREKAIMTANKLSKKVNIITNANNSKEEINKAIDETCKLFINENTNIETSPAKAKKRVVVKIRTYLTGLKLHSDFDKISIEYVDVANGPEFKKARDGSYHSYVTFLRKFQGFNNDKLVYQDFTKKNLTVVLKRKLQAGKSKSWEGNWKVFLSDMVNSSDKEMVESTAKKNEAFAGNLAYKKRQSQKIERTTSQTVARPKVIALPVQPTSKQPLDAPVALNKLIESAKKFYNDYKADSLVDYQDFANFYKQFSTDSSPQSINRAFLSGSTDERDLDDFIKRMREFNAKTKGKDIQKNKFKSFPKFKSTK